MFRKTDKSGRTEIVIYRKYITKNGRRIYPKTAKAFRLVLKVKK